MTYSKEQIRGNPENHDSQKAKSKKTLFKQEFK